MADSEPEYLPTMGDNPGRVPNPNYHNVDDHPANASISKMPIDSPADGSVHEDFAKMMKTVGK